jgi:hypothetical protein
MRLRTGSVIAAAIAVAAALCTSCSDSGGSSASSFEVRPVIMPAQHVTHARANPFGSLHVPVDENAYSALSPSQQTALVQALKAVDCKHPPDLSKSDVRVVCDTYSYAYLLGARIVSGHDVEAATPVAPTVNGVTVQYRIALSLKTGGGEKMWDWTSQHHTDFPDGVYTVTQTSSKPPCGENVKTPCSDFLAYVSDDVVVTVPPTSDPFRTAVLVSGDFNKASATRLAHKMAG